MSSPYMYAEHEKIRIPWILEAVICAALGLGLGIFARYIDLNPQTEFIGDLAISLSDLPFWMMCAIGISALSKNGLAAFANVLLFFAFMDIAYYWYSFTANGIFLKRLFVFWGVAGVAASFGAPFVRWAKNDTLMGFVLSILILAVQAVLTGWSVLGLNVFWFAGSVLFLRRRSWIKTILMALIAGGLGIFFWMWLKENGISSLLRHASREGQESDLMRWIKEVDPQEFLQRVRDMKQSIQY